MGRASEFKKKLGAAGRLLRVASDPPKLERLSGWAFPSAQLNYMITGDPQLGLCRGRLYEFFGPEASGKTTLALQACRSVIDAGGVPVYVDMEHKLLPEFWRFYDPDNEEESLARFKEAEQSAYGYLEQLGIDLDSMLLMQPPDAEPDKPPEVLSADDVIRDVPEYGRAGVDLIVVDSLPAMWPRALLDHPDPGKEEMAARSKAVGKLLRELMSLMHAGSMSVIVINWLSSSFDAYQPETTLCGKAPRYYASVRVRLAHCLQRGDKFFGDLGGLNNSSVSQIGHLVRASIKKNSINIPFRDAKIPLFFGTGFDYMYDCFLFAARLRLISRSRHKNVKGFKVNGEWVVDDPYYKDGRAQMAEKWQEVLQLLCDAAADDGFRTASEEEEEIVVDEETGEVIKESDE